MWLLEILTVWTFDGKATSLIFNMLFKFVTAFFSRSKLLLISWLRSLSKVILEPKKIKSVTSSTFSSSICHEVMGLDALILVYWMLNFKPAFSLSSFTLIERLFGSSLLTAIRVLSSPIWGCWCFSWQSWFRLVIHSAQYFTLCTLHMCKICRVTIYNLDTLLAQMWTHPLFQVWF